MEKELMTHESVVDRVEKLGLNKASGDLKESAERMRKLHIAYQSFKWIRKENIDKFNEHLKKTTDKSDESYYRYDKLAFIKTADYPGIPPEPVLAEMEKAQKLECFDYMEVCKIESVQEVKDPIVFGCVEGCTDKFFVAQWGDDVKVEDILSEGK